MVRLAQRNRPSPPCHRPPSAFATTWHCSCHAPACTRWSHSQLFLSTRLACLSKSDRAQSTMLAAWLLELQLDKLNRMLLEVRGGTPHQATFPPNCGNRTLPAPPTARPRSGLAAHPKPSAWLPRLAQARVAAARAGAHACRRAVRRACAVGARAHARVRRRRGGAARVSDGARRVARPGHHGGPAGGRRPHARAAHLRAGAVGPRRRARGAAAGECLHLGAVRLHASGPEPNSASLCASKRVSRTRVRGARR